MNKVSLVTVSFAICMACGVYSEPDDLSDYHLPPPGPPPMTVFIHGGKPVRVSDSRPKYIERYVSSEFHLFGGRPPPPPPPKRFRLPHPNALPRGPKEPFDIVRAPVIYHQTVTDTDVTRAIADAFDVVEKLRKPGKNKGTSGTLTNMPIPSPPMKENNNVVTNVEFVNHFSEAPGQTGTTTTTIVEAPQQVEVIEPLVAQRPVLLKSSALIQSDYPPIPSAHDLPPLPVSVATSNQLVNEAVVPVVPATTTSAAPANLVIPEKAPSPKLIIPSQSHVTTLAEAVQAPGDPQVRTIIQPVYIPYAVDQNGQPVGPLPDYHTMDFRALISAQNKFVVQDAPSVQQVPQQQPQPQSAPVQIVQEQRQRAPVQYIQEVQPTPAQVQLLQEQVEQQPQQFVQVQQQPQQLVQVQQQPQQLVQVQPQPQQLVQVQRQPQQVIQVQQQPEQLVQVQQQPQQLVQVQQQPQQVLELQQQPQQFVQPPPQPQQLVQVQQQQPQQQQYLVQQDQVTAGDTTSSEDSQAPQLQRRGRIIRRRKKANRGNNAARRI